MELVIDRCIKVVPILSVKHEVRVYFSFNSGPVVKLFYWCLHSRNEQMNCTPGSLSSHSSLTASDVVLLVIVNDEAFLCSPVHCSNIAQVELLRLLYSDSTRGASTKAFAARIGQRKYRARKASKLTTCVS